MQQQIVRLSPHQNGKVLGILFAVSSLVFVMPMLLIRLLLGLGNIGPSVIVILLFPIIYLVAGYVVVAVFCAVYNWLFRLIGGIEFESRP